MTGALPPSSKEYFFTDVAPSRMICRPVSLEPMSVMSFGMLLELSVFPTSAVGPEMMLMTPAGKPIFSAITPR